MTWDSDRMCYLRTESLPSNVANSASANPEEEYSDEQQDDGPTVSELIRYPGSPSPKPVESSLKDAIDTAPPVELRSLMWFMCRDIDAARRMATTKLLTPIERHDWAGKKRKAYETCKNCGEDYHVSHNEDWVCVHHSGKACVETGYEVI